MHETIPDHVHEPDEPVTFLCCDPAEAVVGNEFLPVPFIFGKDASPDRLRMKREHRGVGPKRAENCVTCT